MSFYIEYMLYNVNYVFNKHWFSWSFFIWCRQINMNLVWLNFHKQHIFALCAHYIYSRDGAGKATYLKCFLLVKRDSEIYIKLWSKIIFRDRASIPYNWFLKWFSFLLKNTPPPRYFKNQCSGQKRPTWQK